MIFTSTRAGRAGRRARTRGVGSVTDRLCGSRTVKVLLAGTGSPPSTVPPWRGHDAPDDGASPEAAALRGPSS